MTTFHRRYSLRSLFAFVTVLLLLPLVRAADEGNESHARMLSDVRYLAADELEGRGVGTRGLDLAADYIREQFQKAGLKPGAADGSFFQRFTLPVVGLGPANRIAARGPKGQAFELAVEKDFVPLGLGARGKVSAGLVFAGYGITAPEFNYDDYAGAGVKGKVLILIRREPRQTDKPEPDAPFRGSVETQHAFLQTKIANAVKQGAAGVLLVSDPYSLKKEPDVLMSLDRAGTRATQPIPLVHVKRDPTDAILAAALEKNLATLADAIDADLKPQTRVLEGWTVEATVDIQEKQVDVKNVIGVLEAQGPHAEETIVIGAHYDHLGYGGSGSLGGGAREIHNGADDNASGTAGVIELARRFGARSRPLPRRLVFMTFTGEERGLDGSRHYVAQPSIPLDKTVAMINMDMIGRLKDDKLIVYGTGTAKEFAPLMDELAKKSGLSLRPIATGVGPSDQTSFVTKNIPVLHFFTDVHSDYHRPSDDWEKVSIAGMDRVLGVVEAVAARIASSDARPTYVAVAAPPSRDLGAGERPYFGSIPSFGESGVDGVLLDGVSSGGPAEKAGIRGGDVLVQVGDIAVHNLQDYEVALRACKPGATVKIAVLRGGLRITYPATPIRRQ